MISRFDVEGGQDERVEVTRRHGVATVFKFGSSWHFDSRRTSEYWKFRQFGDSAIRRFGERSHLQNRKYDSGSIHFCDKYYTLTILKLQENL